MERPRETAYALTINGGSSSLKFALFTAGEPPRRHLAGRIERIGLPDAFLSARPRHDQVAAERTPIAAPDHAGAVAALLDWLEAGVGLDSVWAVGHRVVHGGTRFTAPQVVTAELVAELRRLSELDPAHLPGEIAMIEAFTRSRPGLPQIACFDTAFHAAMPRVARLLPTPRRYEEAGVRRYGFHGLSYEYLMEELGRVAGDTAARGRVILAHLGAGASLAAVRDGQCIDTSMGFTPTSGLVMGTRSGDLDPGLLLYLIRRERMTADQVDDLVNRRSGLLGVSDISPDMRDLLRCRAEDRRAAEAVALFCYQAKKWIGAFAAALGGVDTLVFAGGIGESAPPVRAEICDGLGHLGIHLDAARNGAGAALISSDASRVAVRVIRTDEEVVIARAVYRLVETSPT
jgi:acetate kinase